MSLHAGKKRSTRVPARSVEPACSSLQAKQYFEAVDSDMSGGLSVEELQAALNAKGDDGQPEKNAAALKRGLLNKHGAANP